MANDRLINSTQGESIITGLNTIATKLDALKPISSADNGKVVVNGELTAQTSTTKTANGTYNTTTNNEVIVDVANSYSQSDNGKVVSNQQLVSQTAYPTTVTENDTYDTTNYNSITVNVSGGGGAGGSDVIFYDYDGTVVASYSAAEFANLSAMPANPTHTGLTAQGWNWSLSDAKTYVAANGKLNIGQMYITYDGKTRFYFTVSENEPVEFYLTLGSDTELDIDWGDGSEHTRWTSDDGDSSKNHEYTSSGRYVIAITVVTGEIYLSKALYNEYKVEIGNGVTDIRDYAFSDCYTLSSIAIPDSVTSIGDYAFYNCYALSSITIPDSVTDIGNSTFLNCSSLSSISIPDSVTSIDIDAFFGCYTLSSIAIPDSVTSIGDYAFSSCYALSSITIPDSVTSIGGNAFNVCGSLSSITIPDSVTSIVSYAFSGCYALSSITIPDSVTSIGSSAFDSCFALPSIAIPDSVTDIGDGAFSSCYTLSSITFESSTPPDLGGGLGVGATCIIRVPQGSLTAYTSAGYYPDPTQYIYEEY